MEKQLPDEALFAHAVLRCYFDSKLLKEFIVSSEGKDSIFQKDIAPVDEWLSTFKDFGYMLRVGGYDYVLAEYRFKPDADPKDIKDLLERLMPLCNKLLEFLRDIQTESDAVNSKLDNIIEKLASMVAALDVLSNKLSK